MVTRTILRNWLLFGIEMGVFGAVQVYITAGRSTPALVMVGFGVLIGIVGGLGRLFVSGGEVAWITSRNGGRQSLSVVGSQGSSWRALPSGLRSLELRAASSRCPEPTARPAPGHVVAHGAGRRRAGSTLGHHGDQLVGHAEVMKVR